MSKALYKNPLDKQRDSSLVSKMKHKNRPSVLYEVAREEFHFMSFFEQVCISVDRIWTLLAYRVHDIPLLTTL